MCLISIAEQNDKSSTFPGQSAYVPWLVCMDANGDPTSQCDSQVGVSTSAVQQCMKSQASQLLKEYIKVDSPIDATPTVHVNGKQVKTSYSAIRAALCDADPSLKGCSAPVPNDADREVAVEKVPKGVLVVRESQRLCRCPVYLYRRGAHGQTFCHEEARTEASSASRSPTVLLRRAEARRSQGRA